MHVTNHPKIATKGVLKPTLAEVDLTHLIRNFCHIQKQIGPAAVMAIWKANVASFDLSSSKL